MTKTVHVNNQEVFVLPRAGGGSILWWGDRRIELTHQELKALADAFADAAAPQLVVAA